jgi:hypothetical protein
VDEKKSILEQLRASKPAQVLDKVIEGTDKFLGPSGKAWLANGLEELRQAVALGNTQIQGGNNPGLWGTITTGEATAERMGEFSLDDLCGGKSESSGKGYKPDPRTRWQGHGMSARLFIAGLLAVVFTATDVCGQFDWQQGWVVPSRDPRQRRLLKERVVLYAGPAAKAFVESREYGDDAALALSMCSQGVAIQLAAFHASGGLSHLSRRRDLLRLIAQPNCQDAVASWVMQHANDLANPSCANLFLTSPAEYVMGLKSLPNRETEVGWVAQPPAYYTGSGVSTYPGYSSASLSKDESVALGTGLLIALGLYVWWKKRRQACELPA